MAILTNDLPTIASAAALFTNGGSAVTVAELIEKMNPAFNDIPFIEANSTIGHKVTARQSLPETFRRRINQGIKASASGYGSVTESAGIYTGLGQLDKALVDISPDKARIRFMENKGHIQSMTEGFFQDLFYGDPSVQAESFLGLAPRFSSLSAADRGSVQVIDAGGTGSDLCSIWLVGWGEGSVSAFYPMGSAAGIQHNPEDLVTCLDRDGKQFLGYKDWFELKAGVAVSDYRNVVRIANIDWKLLQAGTPAAGITAGAKLIDLMTMAIESLNTLDGVTPVFYCPRIISTYMRLQIQNKANVWVGERDIAGQKVTTFDGCPVRRTDALSLNETVVA